MVGVMGNRNLGILSVFPFFKSRHLARPMPSASLKNALMWVGECLWAWGCFECGWPSTTSSKRQSIVSPWNQLIESKWKHTKPPFLRFRCDRDHWPSMKRMGWGEGGSFFWQMAHRFQENAWMVGTKYQFQSGEFLSCCQVTVLLWLSTWERQTALKHGS